jgi:hypothetical protein
MTVCMHKIGVDFGMTIRMYIATNINQQKFGALLL